MQDSQKPSTSTGALIVEAQISWASRNRHCRVRCVRHSMDQPYGEYDISAIPVLPGQYRLDNSSETGHACSVGVCLGRTNPDVQCKGQRRVLCSVCTKDWYRPTGDGVKKLCKLCPTDGGWTTVVLVSCALVGGLILLVMALLCLHFRLANTCKSHGQIFFKRSGILKSPRRVEGEAALCTIEKNRHFQEFKEKWMLKKEIEQTRKRR